MDKIIAANWKMNMTSVQTHKFFREFKKKDSKKRINKIVIVCPPFTSLPAAAKDTKDERIKLGSQNMHFEKKGAFTGEISAEMLEEYSVEFVIVGHSERRKYFKESSKIVNKKLLSALKNSMVPILCIGENEKERKKGNAGKVVEKQLRECLAKVPEGKMQKIIIAYEPIWAIGTGKNAEPKDAQGMHAEIRSIISRIFGKDTAKKVFIIYGGSVKPENAGELGRMKDINGFLVGGASLDAGSFIKIIDNA